MKNTPIEGFLRGNQGILVALSIFLFIAFESLKQNSDGVISYLGLISLLLSLHLLIILICGHITSKIGILDGLFIGFLTLFFLLLSVYTAIASFKLENNFILGIAIGYMIALPLIIIFCYRKKHTTK